MNKLPLVSPEVFDFLRQLGIEPYTKLNDQAREQLGDGVRLISLFSGERFTTDKQGLRVTVLSGKVRMDPADGLLDVQNTRHNSVFTRQGQSALVAMDDSVILVADSEFLDTLVSWSVLAAYADQTGGEVLVKRLLAVKHSLAFRRMPLEHVVEALQQMMPRSSGQARSSSPKARRGMLTISS
jgi:hypothetical protein